MTKTYTLQGLDCPACAAKIERAVSSLVCIRNPSVNFSTTTLCLEHDGGCCCDIDAKIRKLVADLEPEVVVVASDDAQSKREELEKANHARKKAFVRTALLRLCIGCPLFVLALVFHGNFLFFLPAYLIFAYDVLWKAVKNIARGEVFDENFLMGLASIGAFVLGEEPEAVAVMFFYQIGEFLQDLAVEKSKKSITSLMDIRPDYANLQKTTENGEIVYKKIAPEQVPIDSVIRVLPGEKIPLDGIVLEGKSLLDTRALTGESVPRQVGPGAPALSGCINAAGDSAGVLLIRVNKAFGESTVAKIIELVENAGNRKAKTENFITSFSRIYTPAVVGLAVFIAVLPPLILGAASGAVWANWINRGLIFLVISCPCALVISIPLGFFGGIGRASKQGILVKGGNFLEAMARLDTVVFDKTGTLTRGVFEVQALEASEGVSGEELLRYAALAESLSNHPIAKSIVRAYNDTRPPIDSHPELSNYTELAGRGVSVSLCDISHCDISHSDRSLRDITILAGNEELMRENNIAFTPSNRMGSKVYVAVGGRFMGCIIIADAPKTDAAAAIKALKEMHVQKTMMLSGDEPQIAASVGAELGLDEVYGGLLPARKVEKLESLLSKNKTVAFVGDGVNDAPVLARADVGIAMGGLGSDAAIEAADVVIMTDEPSKVAVAMKVSRETKTVVNQNIVFALGVKGLVLLLGALGMASMWAAVFADVGVALLAVLNSTRLVWQKA